MLSCNVVILCVHGGGGVGASSVYVFKWDPMSLWEKGRLKEENACLRDSDLRKSSRRSGGEFGFTVKIQGEDERKIVRLDKVACFEVI